MKYCRKCNTIKTEEEFKLSKQSKDGLYTYCKICSRNEAKKSYARNGKKNRIYGVKQIDSKSIWVPVVGYEDFYEVSNLGQVKRLHYVEDRLTKNGSIRHVCVKEIILNAWTGVRGYSSVGLYMNGKCKTITVHRIVAMAFLPNPENKPCVNHINGVKTDNFLENLEWCTHKENNDHAVLTGLNKHRNFGLSQRWKK